MNNIFWLDDEGTWTYGQLIAETEELAQHLSNQGIDRHSRVPILAEPSRQFVRFFLACARLGAICVFGSPREPQENLENWFKSIGCIDSVVIPGLVPGIQAINTRTEWLEKLNSGHTVLPTSGSSGPPKGVLHQMNQHFQGALAICDNLQFDQAGRWLLNLPLHHVGGLSIILRALVFGGAVVVSKRPIEESIEHFGITHAALVPTQLHRMLDSPKALQSLSKLKAIVIGGGKASQDLLSKARIHNLPVITSYGLTEMASQVTAPHLLPGRELKLGPDNEIAVRGVTLFKGYLSSEKLEPKLDSEGWFWTKDIGEILQDGVLEVRGRKDNMMISGGENIFAEEIEDALRSLPYIAQAIVVAMPDDEFGERPHAFISWSGEIRKDVSQLKIALRPYLASYKCPVRLWDWPHDAPMGTLKLPRNWFKKRLLCS